MGSSGGRIFIMHDNKERGSIINGPNHESLWTSNRCWATHSVDRLIAAFYDRHHLRFERWIGRFFAQIVELCCDRRCGKTTSCWDRFAMKFRDSLIFVLVLLSSYKRNKLYSSPDFPLSMDGV